MKSLRAPFPWFGGKSRAAHLVWAAFGDVPNYVEPFFGSGAVLLGRPTDPRTETINDVDGYVSNFWRSVSAAPEEVARWADWPVNEADLHARHRWLVGACDSSRELIEEWRKKMKHDPDHFNTKIAGWWVWGICQWIGSGWCAAPEWWARAKEGKRYGDGRRPHLKGNQGVIGEGRTNAGRRARGIQTAADNLPTGGRGGNTADFECRPAKNRGVHTADHEQRPDLTSSRGVLSVENEKRPHLWRGGLGVHASSAEQFQNTRPHLGPARGVQKRKRDLSNSAEWEKRPSLKRGGRGVTREQLPQLSGDGSGSLRGVLRSSGGVYEWMQALANRLRRVRVCCGNWDRIVGPAVTTCIGLTGIFLDPPYSSDKRDPRIYSHDSMTLAREVRDWAVANGDEPKLRIALCGYEGEHEMPGTWQCVPWKAGGGYAASAGNHANAHRERIWFSPHCLPVHERQTSFFKERTA